MKINSKLAIIMFSVVVVSLLIFFLISNNASNKVFAEKELNNYSGTKQLLQNIIKLQDEKLKLLAESIGNDSSFLHSTLLANELGYVDRPFVILSNYANSNGVDIFIYADNKLGQNITNIETDVNNSLIDDVCAVKAGTIVGSEEMLLMKCVEMNYEGQNIGRLLLGYKIFPNYLDLLSLAISKKVKIYFENADSYKEGISRDKGLIYYVYKLSDLFTDVKGHIVIEQGENISVYSKYKSSGIALLFYSIMFILLMVFLYGITWLLVSKRLQNIHELIQDHIKKKALEIKEEAKTRDEISEIIITMKELFTKLDEYETKSKANASLIAIGMSTSMVAHDVRRPLVSMKALLGLLPTVKDDPVQLKKMSATVDQAITRTNAMLNEIMDFSKDASALNPDDHSIDSLIVAGLGEALRSHPEAQVKLEYEFNHETSSVRADPQRMIRVLANIAGNAIEAMADKTTGKINGSLFFRTYLANKDGHEFVGVSIADSGPGIPETALSKLFDPFFTQGKKGGTGLGLAICKKVIDMHGGKIEARNRKQEAGSKKQENHDSKCSGAEFIIELPAGNKRADVNESELIRHSNELKEFREEETKREPLGDTANQAEFMRINKERGRMSYLLIVDDEPLFRESVRCLFNDLGHVKDNVKVVESDSAEKGLDLFQAREFDYVIADIDLGKRKMNGYEFTKRIMQKYPQTHVLIHSNKRKSEMDEEIRQIAVSNPPNPPLGKGGLKEAEQVTQSPPLKKGGEGGFAFTRFMGFLPKPMTSSELLQFLACKSFEDGDVAAALRPPAVYGDLKVAATPTGQTCAKGASASGGGKTVLLVNDDEIYSSNLKYYLKKSGLQVLAATNVSDALQHLTAQKFDAILSDINLEHPTENGYEFLAEVRKKDINLPFIFMSGLNRVEEWPKAEKAGASDYIQLPFETAELLTKLNNV